MKLQETAKRWHGLMYERRTKLSSRSEMSDGIEWIETRERFLTLAQEWDRLADRQRTPFIRHAWLASWWEAFGGTALLICALWRDGELTALFPLQISGGRMEALANVHSPLFRPFARHEHDLETVIRAVLARPRDLIVPALPADDPALKLLSASSATSRRISLVTPHHSSPIIETAGVENYSSRLSAKTRQELGRLRRKMMREHEVEFSLVERPADLEFELQRGLEVEASGWKGARGTAVLSSPATAMFYRLVAQSFHADDRVRLSSITLDGRVVAFDLCLLDHGRLYGLKLGYDEQYRRFGPGLVLQLAEIERCCELGLDAFELLGDAEEYKLRFSTSERRHYMLRSYTRRPASFARYGYRRGIRPVLKQAHDRLRRLRPRG
jgi:CelD/BcsL family acetyltransferase involved in cellulose biosynthesis